MGRQAREAPPATTQSPGHQQRGPRRLISTGAFPNSPQPPPPAPQKRRQNRSHRPPTHVPAPRNHHPPRRHHPPCNHPPPLTSPRPNLHPRYLLAKSLPPRRPRPQRRRPGRHRPARSRHLRTIPTPLRRTEPRAMRASAGRQLRC